MDRAQLQSQLDEAERHVFEGVGHIERQRKLVAELTEDAHAKLAKRAARLLRLLTDIQAMNIARRDDLKNQLAELPSHSGPSSDGRS
jgi:hypothetical protein